MLARYLAVVAILFSLVTASAVAPAFADAGDPAAKVVESFHASLLDTMKRGHELGIQGRYKALEPAADAAFNFPVMTQFIVGPAWSSMSDADHKSIIEGFRRLTLANYASNFDNFNGQRFTLDPNVIEKGSDKFVQTTLVPNGDKPVPLIYRMRQSTDGSWKIIDILLEGYVSELATRRSDFGATITSGGASALLKKMSDLSDSLMSGAKKAAP
jgi:phospholipid transport system substrate-binding protein